ncbi:hypothetical protein FRC09_000359 [Ceratobasidium sp. 395]|nr:hypothetical protein FRC09_000359 [Ceratobasidium sp. 395]
MVEQTGEADIIFVGVGRLVGLCRNDRTALLSRYEHLYFSACVAAGRLAAANPGLEILLIEQGPNNLGEPTVVTPGLFITHLAPTSKTALFWQASKGDGLNGRAPVVASGGILGGGSSINFMMYARASASDFDDWKTPGWGSKDLIPLLQKVFLLVFLADCRDLTCFGSSRLTILLLGVIRTDTMVLSTPKISYSNYYAPIAQEYLDASVHRGIPLVEDLMDTKTGHGCQRLPKYIDPTTGHRQDAAHRYIHTQADNKSLHILTKTKAVRVVFEGTKAIRVEVVVNKAQVPDADDTIRTITARKLVVVSSGAIGTPLVLQRSGVGCAQRLSELGIKTVVDLPGVGHQYEDHVSAGAVFYVPENMETVDNIISGEPGLKERYTAEFAKGQGLLTTNALDAASKLRPTPEELKEMGPAFQEVWKRFYEPAPDKPVILQTFLNGFLGLRQVSTGGRRCVVLANIQAYPVSKGHVYITSGDPYAAPDFKTGYLDEKADVAVHIWAYKQGREVARRMPSFRGECAALHPKFPEGSAATCASADGPFPLEAEDIVYTAEDNVAIEAFMRETMNTTWHSIATVPMKPKEQGGCVDGRLNVYGTTNLKVAGSNVGANTNSTALLVGEKAAILIAEDLGLCVP